MSGSSDDDDYWVPPGTISVNSAGPTGPCKQLVDGVLCRRPTKQRSAADMEAALAEERRIYAERVRGDRRKRIPLLPPIPALPVELSEDDIVEDE